MDNHIKWANLNVVHDGDETDRFHKTGVIVRKAQLLNQWIPIKVCYSVKYSGLNCSRCGKCCITILSIILHGADPNSFGFEVSEKVYDHILVVLSKGFTSVLAESLWQELGEAISNHSSFYIFSNEVEERKRLLLIKDLINDHASNIVKPTRLTKTRRRLQLQYPRVYNILMNIFRKLKS